MNSVDLTQPTERRRCPRLGEELLIACRSRNHVHTAVYFTRNLSGGGLMFESPASVSSDTTLDIECYTPIGCEKQTMQHMRMGAQVRWTREIPEACGYEGSNRYTVGVAFDQIDPADQVCLDEYVKKRLAAVSVQRIA